MSCRSIFARFQAKCLPRCTPSASHLWHKKQSRIRKLSAHLFVGGKYSLSMKSHDHLLDFVTGLYHVLFRPLLSVLLGSFGEHLAFLRKVILQLAYIIAQSLDYLAYPERFFFPFKNCLDEGPTTVTIYLKHVAHNKTARV